MTYPPYRRRRSIRLKGCDYSLPGAYFVTICTHQRELLFDAPEFQKVVQDQWAASASMRRELRLDAFVVMPNHIHGIVWIAGMQVGTSVGAQGLAPLPQQPPKPHVAPHSLGSFVRGFKSAVTHEINRIRNTPGAPVWQHNYYEHVIRDDQELDRIRVYVQENPAKWQEDENNPVNFP